jgi:very-short-patch-repair endonuclease
MTDSFAPFRHIRSFYAEALPHWMEEYGRTKNMVHDPYGIDLTSHMTPIEFKTWQAIRTYDVPMYPQIPALQYFLDFANPFLKIAIECDGKQWHNAEKDKVRDKRLRADGWTIYRATGKECNRVMPDPWERFHRECSDDSTPTDEEQGAYWHDWFCNCIDGLVVAIKWSHFGKTAKDSEFHRHAGVTLAQHCSATGR